jgi:hypothetical protein
MSVTAVSSRCPAMCFAFSMMASAAPFSAEPPSIVLRDA